MGQQTRLEKEGLNYRENNLPKSEYQRESNEYSAEHPNAKSDGDARGKGVGTAAHAYLLPDENASKTSYKNTLITDKGGSSVDTTQRTYLQSINLYNENRAYGPNSVDTSANVADGQIIVK